MFIGVANPYHCVRLMCWLVYNNYYEKCNISISKNILTFDIKLVRNLTYVALYVNLSRKKNIPKAIKINNNIIPLLVYKPKREYNIILAIVNFYQVKNYKQVIDVIEISKLYGVEHIVIYATSSTIFIKSILFYYHNNNYVEIIPFCFNPEIKHVHETGQIEKINDVLYRYMYNTKYIIFNDIDEIILPMKNHNYNQFLSLVDNHSSDMYIFKSKLFPYFSNNYNSIVKHKHCCIIKRGYEKYIVGNLYKFDILSVHDYTKSFLPIKIRIINETYGFVRHTRYKGKMCKTDLIDSSLSYLENYLKKKYEKFESIYNNSFTIYYYGKNNY